MRPGTVKMIWRDQRSQLAVLIKNAISDISDAQVPDSTICWLAGLLKAELRRGGRHPVTLTEMLRGEPASLPVLRNFLLNRLELYPLKPQSGPFYMRLTDPPVQAPDPVRAPVVITDSENHHKDEIQSKPESALTAVPVPVAQPVHRKEPTSPTGAEAVRCLASWWENVVPHVYRQDVLDEAQRQLSWQWPNYVVSTTALTAQELFKQTRPPYEPETDPELINFWVAWLLGWCLALTSDWRRVSTLLVRSYGLAEKEELPRREKEAQNMVDISQEGYPWKLPFSMFLLTHCSSEQ